ncbi:MAG: bifunctional adenosylcobinamide kinase/adenosylcobinamide-phosphate guanylyltransferase [Gammaproteobacteria bacterium]|nr:bifunctional adenosylcobinamide kinase/adenosylcobinamide-phosphate guanylyltransferase [Gammaproteobacteria bacterium]MBU1647687.1 bifunctional adenosylcobinamide kinase/adenosylcobinamide-phosphate guanylyltransferase [Gammaproteobacteria bacterium]MBU1971833.1 bifunctional adenosylcobinamide kinase/adenosylcobinamide-phosphate guanylyltransferase [Gammaproteobacteria bacterium]
MHELILGGARSGKSALALRRAADSGLAVTWLATAQALDPEMAERIARHRAERPAGWRTVEEPLRLAAALRHAAGADAFVVVDCLTLWLTNLLLADDAALLQAEIAALFAALPELPGHVILVANEVGLGIVPDNALARHFRDEAGRLNQTLAALCDRVTFVAAGLPLALK